MNIWDIIVGLLVAALLVFAFWLAKDRKRNGCCGSGGCEGCSGCAGKETCGEESCCNRKSRN